MSAAGGQARIDAGGSAIAFPWLTSRLVRAEGVRHLRLGQRTALFCARAQQLFELNATAEIIWRALAGGRTPKDAADELVALGAPAEQALAFVIQSAAAWLAGGQLIPQGVLAAAGGAPAARLNLRIADLSCALALHAPAGDPLVDEVRAVFGQFEGEAERSAELRLAVAADGGAWFLLRDGAPLGAFAPDRIVPEIKAVLTERLAARVGDGAFLLHGALLSGPGGSVLLSGAPGAGKTTLTVALAASGLGYGSDDIVRVAADGALSGVPFAPAVKTGAWALAAAYAPQLAGRPPHRRGDGQAARYLPLDGFAPYGPAPLAAVLLLDRQAGEAARLEPLEPLPVLTELLASGFAADHRLAPNALEALAAQVAAARCARLIYSDLDEAVALVRELAA